MKTYFDILLLINLLLNFYVTFIATTDCNIMWHYFILEKYKISYAEY